MQRGMPRDEEDGVISGERNLRKFGARTQPSRVGDARDAAAQRKLRARRRRRRAGRVAGRVGRRPPRAANEARIASARRRRLGTRGGGEHAAIRRRGVRARLLRRRDRGPAGPFGGVGVYGRKARFAFTRGGARRRPRPRRGVWSRERGVVLAARMRRRPGGRDPARGRVWAEWWGNALHAAAERGHAFVLEALLEHARPAALLARDANGRTPVEAAARWGHADALRVFLRTNSGSNSSVQTPRSTNPDPTNPTNPTNLCAVAVRWGTRTPSARSSSAAEGTRRARR